MIKYLQKLATDESVVIIDKLYLYVWIVIDIQLTKLPLGEARVIDFLHTAVVRFSTDLWMAVRQE